MNFIDCCQRLQRFSRRIHASAKNSHFGMAQHGICRQAGIQKQNWNGKAFYLSMSFAIIIRSETYWRRFLCMLLYFCVVTNEIIDGRSWDKSDCWLGLAEREREGVSIINSECCHVWF